MTEFSSESVRSSDANDDVADMLRRAETLVFVQSLDVPVLSADDLHHLRNVLRLRDGAIVAAADNTGNVRRCRFTASAKRPRGARHGAQQLDGADVADLAIDGPIRLAPSYSPVTVAFALIKGDRNDWVIQKLTELGIERITPIITDRTIVRLDDDTAAKRGDRMRRIAREASMQARRSVLPIVEDPQLFADAARTIDGSVMAEPGAPTLTEPLSTEIKAIFIGPEGGWSDSELSMGLRHVGLGPTVLRAETAAIVAGVRLTVSRTSSR